MNFEAAKQQVAEVARKMAELGLISGTSGNVSARLQGGLLAITPMGKSYESMSSEDIVVVDGDLNAVERGLDAVVRVATSRRHLRGAART